MTVDTATAFGRARDEIEIIDRELQAAFDRIIDAVERVMDVAETLGPERSAGIGAAVAEILEASIVRDIAGQRLTAVRVAVDRLVAEGSAAGGGAAEGGRIEAGRIERRLERNRDKSSEIEEKQRRGSTSESGLLNGPQLPGAAKTQTEVDALFDKLD